MSTISWSALFVPRQPAWLLGTCLAAAIALVGYAALAWYVPWSPGRFGGLTAGVLAAASFGTAALYPARRRLCVWPLSTAQRWLQVHIYGAAFGTLLVFIHIGFRLPAGKIGWALLGLSLWTTVTGLAGVYLQKSLPLVLTRNLQVEAIYERIHELVARLARDADDLMAGASDVMNRSYRTTIRTLLESPRPSWAYLRDPRGGRSRVLEPLAQLEPFVQESDRGRLMALEIIIRDKLDLDVHMSLQRALRVWLIVHVPPAAVLLGVIVVHVIAVVYL